MSLFVPDTERSPTRRATVTAARDSPPPGFHSWLVANGLTVVNNTSTSAPSIEGLTSALNARNTLAPSGTLVTTPATISGGSAQKTPKSKPVKQVDLTKDSDDEGTKKKSKPEVGEKGIETVGLTKLSKYFDDRMKSLEGYVPLSIFNSLWLQQDLLRQTARTKTTKEKLDDNYVGLSVPSEWRMSFGEWVMAFDLYITYLRHYDHGVLADKFTIHKENVFAIQRQRLCWPMAF